VADSEIKFDNRKATKFFSKISKSLEDIDKRNSDYVRTIAAIVFKDVLSHFQKEQGPKSKWEQWSEIYGDHMETIGKGGNNILQDTGRLRQSFMPTNYRKNPLGIEFFNPAKTAAGFPYAKAHDEGLGILPERSFMWLSKKAAKSVSDVTLAYIVKGK